MSRNKWLHLALIAVISATVLASRPVAAQDGPPGLQNVPDELIVRLAPSADPQRFAAANGLELGAEERHKVPGRPIYRFTIVDGSTPNGKAGALNARPGVIYAEPNYEGVVPEAQKRSSWAVGFSVDEYAAQWAADRIGLPRAHLTTTGAGVTVAILDTGVDFEHPALAGHLVPGYDFVDDDDWPEEELADEEDNVATPGSPGETGGLGAYDGSGAADGYDAMAAYGHGTHVAGLVALAAPGAAIMPLRTLHSDGTGDLWTQVLALRYAAYRGADVINLSFTFGSQRSAFFDDVVAEVTCSAKGFVDCRSSTRPGAIVVAAAGNAGSNIRQWPAASALSGLLAVGASTDEDKLASFSSYGGWVPLAAPGDRVLSTVPGGRYEAWSGTSMAAPLTAGVSALVRATSPRLTPADVIRQIMTTADPIDAGIKRRLDAAAAVAPVVMPAAPAAP